MDFFFTEFSDLTAIHKKLPAFYQHPAKESIKTVPKFGLTPVLGAGKLHSLHTTTNFI
jgi:hypothetical protein